MEVCSGIDSPGNRSTHGEDTRDQSFAMQRRDDADMLQPERATARKEKRCGIPEGV